MMSTIMQDDWQRYNKLTVMITITVPSIEDKDNDNCTNNKGNNNDNYTHNKR